MSRKAWVAVGAVVGVGLVCFSTFWLATSGPGIARERFDAIEVGMREQTVEALLGGPPDNYTTTGPLLIDEAYFDHYRPGETKEWVWDDGVVLVRFDGEGRVYDKRLIAARVKPRTLFDRVRRLLHLD